MSMNGYPYHTLRQLTTLISSGSTPLGGQSVYLDGGPVMLVRSQNVQMNRLDVSDVAYISNEIDSQMQRSVVRHNDVLLNITGASIGRVARFSLKDTRANVNQHVCIIRPKPDQLSSRYLEYFLSSPQVQNDINNRHQHGGTRQALTFSQISEFEIPLPPLSEQKRIADILDKADAIRRKRQEVIDLSQDILRSAYLHCFGDPIANPQSWPMKELGELADMVTGFAFKSSEYVGEGVRLCRGANVLPEQIDWSDVRYWRVEDSTVDDKLKLEEGDVVLAMDRPWISSGIKVAQLTESDLPAYLVQRVTRLRGIGHVSNAFLYYTIRHPAFTAHCGGLKTETTVPHISSADIKSFRVPVAPRHIHETFEALANSTQTGFQRLRRAANEATSLFNSLVQLAFKGEL